MAKSVITAFNFDPDVSTANTTQYWSLVGDNSFGTTDASKEITFRAAGTLSNLRFTVPTESFAANSTWRLRKNRANGNQNIVFQTTGTFEDTSNSDSVSAGDEFNYQHVPPASGTMTFEKCELVFAPSSDTVSVMGTNSESWSAASTTSFFVINGLAQSTNTTESNANCEQRKSGTFKWFGINISANGRTTTTTVRTRKAGANGNCNIPITTETGIVEDTTNSDSVAAGNDFNLSVVTGTGTQTLTMIPFINFVTTDGVAQYICGRTAGYTVDGNDANTYYPLRGKLGIADQTTEADAQLKLPENASLSELTLNISLNTMESGEDNIITLRKGGVATALTVTNTFTQTGIISDSTHSVSCSAADLLSIEFNPAGAATDDMVVRSMSVWSTVAQQQNIERALPTETVSISESLARLAGKIRAPSTETVSSGESIARLTTKNRAPSTETVTIGESATRMTAKSRSLATETVTTSDSVARTRGKVRVIEETVTIGESLNRLAAKTRTISETVSTGESLTRIKGAIRSLSTETVVISDNVARIVAHAIARSITETVSISESIARLKSSSRTLSETVTTGDSAARVKGVTRSLADTVSIGETLARIKASIRSISETVPISESLNRLAAKIRTIPIQTVAVADLVDRVVTQGQRSIHRTITETVSISDNLARMAAKQRTIEETVAITSVLQGYKNGVELVPPEEPTQPTMGRITQMFIRAPKKQLHLHEIREGINEKAYCSITIPAFSDFAPKAYCPIRLIEQAPKIGARITLRPQLRLAKSRITVDAQYDNGNKAYAPRIALQPQEEGYQKAKAKIINPQQLNRMAKLMRLFFMAQQLDD